MNVIIMAAGHGTRMKSDLPKPLVELGGKPMIQHIFDAVNASGICEKPVIVVSPDNINLFKEVLGDTCQYAVQEEQLGTGHAVMAACGLLDHQKPTIVLNGDHPMVSAEMIKKLSDQHTKHNATLTLGVVTVPSFDDWYSAFESWGRIVRDENGRVARITEAKDATEDQLTIKEVNPTYFCLDSEWMCDRLTGIDNNNAQKEYYLTDLVKIAVAEKCVIASSPVTPEEGIGVNTPEHREMAENILSKRNS